MASHLIQRLKQFLGRGDEDESTQTSSGTAVTVERTPGEQETEAATHDSVGSTGDAGAHADAQTGDDPESETGSTPDAGTDTTGTAATDTDTTAGTDTDTDTADEAVSAETRAADADDDHGAAATDTAAGVDTITGIGSTYAERLATEGIETVEDLAAADPEAVAAAADAAESRAESWVEQARD